jgi:phage baseplate assembly protein W
MPQHILQDINVQDKFVTTSTDFMLYDTKVVVQSIWRLITTEEGEIPNFRAYGLSIKRFSQYPYTKETIDTIYNYVKDRVTAFEERGEIIRADVDSDIENGLLFYTFYVQVRTTGDVVKLPTWTVTIGA